MYLAKYGNIEDGSKTDVKIGDSTIKITEGMDDSVKIRVGRKTMVVTDGNMAPKLHLTNWMTRVSRHGQVIRPNSKDTGLLLRWESIPLQMLIMPGIPSQAFPLITAPTTWTSTTTNLWR